MASRRMNLGPTPEVALSSVGRDLEIRGTDYAETILDTDGPDSDAVQAESSFSLGASGGDCRLRLPAGGKVRLGTVCRDMTVKSIQGGVEIESVGKDFVSRRCGPLHIGHIGGDAALRETSGEIDLGSVAGDCVVERCSGPARIGQVGGDCEARDVPAGLEAGDVCGDLKVRTAIAPGASFKASAGRDLEFRFPADSSLRVVVPADSKLHLDREMKTVAEGDHLIITVGGGKAIAELSAQRSLRVRFDDTFDRDREFRTAVDRDFDAYMTDVSAQLDTHLRAVERHLNDLPERIRQRVERKIDAAIRNVESAERHARRAAERAGTPVGSSGAHEPVSEQERLAILKMLEEGKIGVQDAEALLAALEGEG